MPDHFISPLLQARDAARIARHASHGDAARWLHPIQQALLYRRDWLRMLAPRAVGGGELPLPDVVRLEEALARVDGSVALTVTLCAGAGWFTGYLEPALARAILATPRACLAGSGARTGYADREGDGWRIDGVGTTRRGRPWPPSTLASQAYGFLFDGCVFLADAATTKNSVFLARQWDDGTGAVGKMIICNSVLGDHIALGTGPWNATTVGGAPTLFRDGTTGEPYLAEYNNWQLAP